jgi:nicotinamidase/pyrazinamidase
MRRNALEDAVLVVVDVQPDFLPGGTLPVPGGDAVLAPIRRMLEVGAFPLAVATQDWHPAGHVSFASSHPGRSPMDVIELYGHDQTLWPDHCVQGTAGAQLVADLPWESVSAIIRKGTLMDSDSYSGFRNNWDAHGRRPRTGLAGYLRERGVEHVFVCGLARDYCVKWTAEDAAEEGFRTTVLWDATRAVIPASDAAVRKALERNGIRIATVGDLLD